VSALNFTNEDWARVERDTSAWWAGELERPLVYLAATDPLPDGPPYSYLSNYPMDLSAEAIVDRHAPLIEATHYYGDAFPWWWMNFGPGIMAGFLGAEVHSVSDPSETVWFTNPSPGSIEALSLTYDPDNTWWKRVKAITQAAAERWDGMVAVGHTDLGGNLDILASFRGTQELLFEVLDHPDEVDRLVAEITDLWIRYYDKQRALIQPPCRGTTCWTPIWSPGTTYMLQCDFSYMISPAMFERFVMPDLAACCEHLDHGFYHLDGKGEIPHLDLLLSIERLRGIQWIPGDGQPSPDQWLPLLKRIRDGGKLCQVFVTPECALRIVRNLGGRGFLLVIAADEAFRDPEQAQAFLKTLNNEDISQH
jgi:5-methyltetrahydrofolate--homocysteine methyltransferase